MELVAVIEMSTLRRARYQVGKRGGGAGLEESFVGKGFIRRSGFERMCPRKKTPLITEPGAAM
jgi:hypothetical protein